MLGGVFKIPTGNTHRILVLDACAWIAGWAYQAVIWSMRHARRAISSRGRAMIPQ